LNVSAQKLRKECHGLENLLEGNLYLSGDRPSAADAVCFPEICLIERAIETKFYDMEILGLTSMPIEFPRLQAWKKRMLGLEGVYQTIPSDWSIRM
jgi:glutathione S-transferase